MSEKIESFQFRKVEEFFEDYNNHQGYRNWSQLGKVESYELYEKSGQVALTFKNDEGDDCVLILRFPAPNIFRLRFNPSCSTIEDYTEANTRSIVKDTFKETSDLLDQVTLSLTEEDGKLVIDVFDKQRGEVTMKIYILMSKYALSVYKPNRSGKFFKIHSDAATSIYYKKRLCYISENHHTIEYSIIQGKVMNKTAKYIGFGEKGGSEIYRNGARLTYFNFDNMRYRQIYQNGPLDVREPLYDSDPFFMELNGNSDLDSAYGMFIDNASATYFDLGSYNNNQEYLFGSLYGELDTYFFMGGNAQDVMKSYLSLVGISRLKPRFVLGYHQGCYGYENEDMLHDAVNGYRGNNIPLDGLHVDVDVQRNYCTFTMDESKFSPETFDKLEARGIKCSTNITPVISYINRNYKTYESGNKNNFFVGAALVSDNSKEGYYRGGVFYGGNRGTFGHYADLGRKDVRYWWGEQYRLLYSRGLAMVWQDMTTPCIPNPKENWDTYIYSEKDQESYKIGDRITGDMRSFPFGLYLTDNLRKKYEGEAAITGMKGSPKVPAARIRNIYSYNLHKATYHGINSIWTINNFTFTKVGDTGITTEESILIISSLKGKKIIRPLDIENVYELEDQVNLEDPNIDLGLPKELQQYRDEVISILKQSRILKERRKNKRNFIIGRGGFSGMHRFAGLWTGDNSSSWDFLKINIVQVLALSLTGQTISGQDIGGFEREQDWEKWADPELLIRWTAAGSFLPWFRNHYIQKGQKLFQEPYKYQDYKHLAPVKDHYLYDAVLPICRYYIQLRYRLLQLFYDCMFESTLSGMPIVRPMFLHDKTDPSLFGEKASFLNNQFFVGNDLLVAPVIEKQETGSLGRRQVYLPALSNWYAFKNNLQPLSSIQAGGSTILYDAYISSNDQHVPFVTPVYVREGAIIPTVELEQFVGQLHKEEKPNPVTLNIYPGVEGRYVMFEDDGISRSSAPAGEVKNGADPEAKGHYRKSIITHQQIFKTKKVEVKWVHNNYKPYTNFFIVALLHDPSEEYHPVQQIKLKTLNAKNAMDQSIPEIKDGQAEQNANSLWNSSVNAWYYNPSLHISFIKVFTPEELNELDPDQTNESKNTNEKVALGLSIEALLQ